MSTRTVTGPFVVPVAALRRRTGATRHEVRRGVLALAPARPGETTVPEGAEAHCDVTLAAIPGAVVVTGTVRAPWAGVCRRCLAPLGGEVSATVHERFVDPPADDEAYELVDGRADLGPMVAEAVLLELPAVPLCRADCAGLCPQCGCDRNTESCTCEPPVDPRWANLDVLRDRK